MKQKDNKNKIILLFVVFVVVFLFNFIFKDKKNMILEKIYFINNKKLIINEQVTSDYINYLENEIMEYKKIGKLKDCINASTIYRNPIYWYDEIVINKGKNDNINVGDMVINNDGIVGSVYKVLENSASVLLLTSLSNDRKITLALNSNDKIIYGILSNYNKIKNEFEISELTSDIIEEENISVITTSFTNTFKDGIIVGNVIDIIDDNNGLSKKAVVKPVVNYNNLNYVCVINK